MENTKFSLAEILTIITGFGLMGGNPFTQLEPILNYMAGRGLHPEEFPEAMQICRKALLFQYPYLNLTTKGIKSTEKDCLHFLRLQEEKFGKELEVQPLDPNIYRDKNPLDAIKKVYGADKILSLGIIDKEKKSVNFFIFSKSSLRCKMSNLFSFFRNN